MATVYDTDEALATFRCGGLDPHLFLLTSWRGEEAVSGLYRFELELASSDDSIDLENLLGRRASLAVRAGNGDILPWHGIITEIKQTRRDASYAYYFATLEPQLALLRLFRQSRVYMHADQNSGGGEPDLADIIRMVLQQVGLSQEGEPSATYSPDYAIRIPASDLSATRANFICQFEETSLAFLQRKLEHYGVYFWFEQGYDKEIVVFGNQRGQQPDTISDVYWRAQGQVNPEADTIAITRFDHGMRVQPKAVVLREFSIKQPSLDLTINADIDPQAVAPLDRFDGLGNIEVYGSHYSKQDQGDQIARLRAEELACMRNSYAAEAIAPGLRAGYSINLHEHFRPSLDGEYYITTISHEGHQSLPQQTTVQDENSRFYQAKFTVIPAKTQFRPARRTVKPRIVGFLSAIVEAEGDGQYAEMNEYGCYRIRFLFAPPGSGQQGSANSAWVRMATPYAGSQHGLNLPLLKGTEVLVSFLGGDPDRPVIISAVPNEENPSLRNQTNASQPALQTAGQNTLSFEDKAGAESARLTSPNSQSTLHLGNDPDKPDATGIRLSTTGHHGTTSSSYIMDIPGKYRHEVGHKGKVGLDPVAEQAVKQAIEANKAKALLEQALLPNASPAEQMSALNAKNSLIASTEILIATALAAAQKASPIDDVYIATLKKQAEQVTKAKKDMAALLEAVANGTKSEQDAVAEVASAEAAPEPEPAASSNDDSSSITNWTHDPAESKWHYGASSDVYLAANSDVILGATSLLTAGLSIGTLLGMGITMSFAGRVSIDRIDAKAVTFGKQVELTPSHFFTGAKKEEKIVDYSGIVANYDLTAADYSCQMAKGLVSAAAYQIISTGIMKLSAATVIQQQVGASKLTVSPAAVEINSPLATVNGRLIRVG